MLYKEENGIISAMEQEPFALEKELQAFFERNMYELTGYRFLETEFTVGSYRMDSIAYNEETDAFIIVEYKRGRNESLVDQGYAYLKTLLDRKAEFVLLYNEKTGASKLKKDFDWSQTKIAFVSPAFTKNQKDATAFNGMAFELYEVKRYQKNIYSVVQINQQKVAKSEFENEIIPAGNTTMAVVSKELVEYDFQFLCDAAQCNAYVRETYEEVKNRILEIYPELQESFRKNYCSLKMDNVHNLVAFWLKKDWIEVVFSARIGDLKDPYGVIYDISNRKWSAAQYAMKIKPGTDPDMVVDLVKQCYKLSKYAE